jgi:hypothetical protein
MVCHGPRRQWAGTSLGNCGIRNQSEQFYRGMWPESYSILGFVRLVCPWAGQERRRL